MTSHARRTKQRPVSISNAHSASATEEQPVTALRRVRFCDAQRHTPEDYYRQPEEFDRSNTDWYRPGRWADTTSKGFVDTSGLNDPNREWTEFFEGEFLWTHVRTPELRRGVRWLREAICDANRRDEELKDEAQVEAMESIQRQHYELALQRALILRHELVGMEQTQAEWEECCDIVLRPSVLPRKVFSRELHAPVLQLSREVSEMEVA